MAWRWSSCVRKFRFTKKENTRPMRWTAATLLAILSPAASASCGRRAFLATASHGAILSRVARPRPVFAESAVTDDAYSHWSFFGLAPPPIAGILEYEDLVGWAKSGAFRTVQPAVQHDVLIATTLRGWRYAAFVRDSDIATFVLDCTTDTSVPFTLLARDPTRAAVRDVAALLLDTTLLALIADQWDLLPWKLTSFDATLPPPPSSPTEDETTQDEKDNADDDAGEAADGDA